MGILSLPAALKLAQERGLDLVEVASQTTPPVCRVMDYGKYRYEQTKRLKESHKNQTTVKLKEIRLRPNIDQHDYLVKVHQAQEFLNKRYKVRLSMRFRGRENVHKNLGIELINKFAEDVKDSGVLESSLKHLGKIIFANIGPISKNKGQKKTPLANNQDKKEKDK